MDIIKAILVLTLFTLAMATGEAQCAAQAQSPDTQGMINILDMASPGAAVDRSGAIDVSAALRTAVEKVNAITHYAKDHPARPACIYLPTGTYRLSAPPPMFRGAGCVVGDGSGQTIINLDPTFAGDLFSWAEAWIVYNTSGATVRRLRINGAPHATKVQNALVFYDRNDNVTLEDLYINDVPGRAIGVGLLRPVNSAGQAYIRESNFQNLRIFGCGTIDLPAVEITSQGTGREDGTNEVNASQIDIYGSRGTSLVIRNSSLTGIVRDLKFNTLRIEGSENGNSKGDLIQIGNAAMTGGVGHLFFTNLELIDPAPGYAALRVTAAGPPGSGPSRIVVNGYIGGGLSKGEGVRIDNGSLIQVTLNQIRTEGINVVVGPNVKGVVLDGGGAEAGWTYAIDPTSRQGVSVPARLIPFAR